MSQSSARFLDPDVQRLLEPPRHDLPMTAARIVLETQENGLKGRDKGVEFVPNLLRVEQRDDLLPVPPLVLVAIDRLEPRPGRQLAIHAIARRRPVRQASADADPALPRVLEPTRRLHAAPLSVSGGSHHSSGRVLDD